MCPTIDQLKTNDAFFEQMRAQEQAFYRNSYIFRHRERIHTLISAEVKQDLADEVGKKVTAVLCPTTRTMKTELQEIER